MGHSLSLLSPPLLTHGASRWTILSSSTSSPDTTSSSSPQRNSNSERSSSFRPTRKSTSTTPPVRPGLSDTTSSPTGPQKSTVSSLVTVQSSALLSIRTSQPLSTPSPTLTPLTGLPREPLPQSRIRAAADLAGPSPLPVLLSVLTRLRLATSSHTLRCSSSTVTTASPRTWDATVVLWTRPSPMPNPTPSPLRKPTHTPQNTPRVTLPSLRVPPLRLQPSSMSRRTTQMPSRLSSTRIQSPSPSRPTRWSSRDTRLESSPVTSAEPTLITVSSQSATELKTEPHTTLSRTPGTPPGETRDTSRSASKTELVSAVSRADHLPSQPPTEHDVITCLRVASTLLKRPSNSICLTHKFTITFCSLWLFNTHSTPLTLTIKYIISKPPI